MSRAREFEEGELLDRALAAFWRLGFDACSIGELVEATGVKRQSLYNAYGDKLGLFLAVAAHYRAAAAESLEPLLGPEAGLIEIRSYIEGFLGMLRGNGFRACLLVRTAFTPTTVDPRVREIIEASAASVRSAFAHALKNAARRGELPKGTNVSARAAYLFSILHGLTALEQTGGTRRQIADAISHAFATLC